MTGANQHMYRPPFTNKGIINITVIRGKRVTEERRWSDGVLGNGLDIVIVIILIVSLIIGYRKGFTGALTGIISTLAGLGVAYVYRQAAAEYLQQNYGLVSILTTYLEKHLGLSLGVSDPGRLTSLPMVNEGLALVQRQINEIAYGLVVALCFLIIYMVTSLVISVIALILGKLLPGGSKGVMNRIGGAAIIMAQNVLIMAALVGILQTPMQMSASLGGKGTAQTLTLMQESMLVPYLLKIFAWLQGIFDIFL
ncbi:MAG: CvpA family protein, partial [Firmicutes bacterium]|nr:CvpA family protein [Bacillota bacterium]